MMFGDDFARHWGIFFKEEPAMLKNPSLKYQAHPPVNLTDRQWPDNTLTHPPRWLSTDLRDGNQSLAEPMDNARKMKFWDLLIACGFREIEVAFPLLHKPILILCGHSLKVTAFQRM